jgi:hypothetical protein
MTDDDKENLAAIIGIVLATMSLGVFFVFFAGWAAVMFWNLFAPPMLGWPEAEWRNGIGFVGFLMCVRGCLGSEFSIKSRRS